MDWMKLNVPVKILPFVVLSTISLLVYLLAPSEYVWEYVLYCGIHYIVSLFLFFFYFKKKNYFDFDTIFLVSFFFVFFVYPIFLYPINPLYFFMFALGYDTDVISRATALALLGSQMYMLGGVIAEYRMKKKETQIYIPEKTYLPTKLIHYFTIFLFIAFLLSGGFNFFVQVYRGGGARGEGSVFNYIYALFTAMFMVSIVVEFNKLKILNSDRFQFSKFSKALLFLSIFSSAILLYSGTRTVVLQIWLGLGGIYALLYRSITLKLFLLLLLLGTSLMFGVVFVRSGIDFMTFNSGIDIFMDLIINNRTSFVALEYVENNGFTFGKSMLGSFLRVVPFSQSIVFSALDIDPDETTSAMVFTLQSLGDDPTWGVGTNIIADLYLAFGFWGVFLLMFLLGYIVHKSEYMAKIGNIYYLAIYTILISLSVYMVRSELMYGLNLIVWTLILINIFRHFSLRNNN